MSECLFSRNAILSSKDFFSPFRVLTSLIKLLLKAFHLICSYLKLKYSLCKVSCVESKLISSPSKSLDLQDSLKTSFLSGSSMTLSIKVVKSLALDSFSLDWHDSVSLQVTCMAFFPFFSLRNIQWHSAPFPHT